MHTFSEQGHPLALFTNRAPSLVLSGREMLQATTISGCRPWSATINPSPPQSPNTVFRGMAAVSGSDVWAVGFTIQTPDENSPALTLIEHWDGQSWQIIPSPNPNPEGDNALFGVAAISANDVWAVGFSGGTPGARGFGIGQTLIEHWDGTGWQVIPSPSLGSVSNSLEALAVVGPMTSGPQGLPATSRTRLIPYLRSLSIGTVTSGRWFPVQTLSQTV